MDAYKLEFADEWGYYFEKLDRGMRDRVWKKIQQLKQPLPSRHLRHGYAYSVAEVGQYRIVFREFEEKQVKLVYFVGTHKEYIKWVETN